MTPSGLSRTGHSRLRAKGRAETLPTLEGDKMTVKRIGDLEVGKTYMVDGVEGTYICTKFNGAMNGWQAMFDIGGAFPEYLTSEQVRWGKVKTL